MRRGLTTVEVLVASAIVIVFLIVGFPAAQALTRRAEGSACAERLHTLGVGLTLYANDHEGWLPPATTVEWAYPSAPADELAASPALLQTLLRPYVASRDAWFCPVDPHARENVRWLGQRHGVTSYAFAPAVAEGTPWPPKAQLGHGGAALLTDAVGVPSKDSARRFADKREPTTNHPDGIVNVLAQDLSLSRHSAGAWLKARG